MDASEQYAKMCEKAEEIQDLWKHSKRNSGDWYYNKGMCWAYVVTEIDQEDVDCIWLPRQDQLQEILEFPIGSFCDNFWSALGAIHKWAFDKKWLDYIPLTMEQLWLAFVMKERWNKVWDGNDWQ